MTAFKHAKFIKTAVHKEDFPIVRSQSGKILPEVAVAGRSNVGKSSLLNNLFQCKGLVKTSSTPGKTQAINFFILDDSISFVDLPGYGFAKVPLSVKKEWGPMIQNYLYSRDTLKLILFLFDIRRTPNHEDKEFIEWVAKHEMAMILVITKVDKVNQKEKRDNTKNILDALNTENLHHVFYSTTKNIGRRELIRLIDEALEDEKA